MHRPRLALGFLLAPILFTMVFATLACSGGGAEQTILTRFFQASRLRDNVTLGGISVVAYDPNTEGIVERFSVISEGTEQVQPLHLKELARAHDEAKKADEEFTKKKLAFQDQHADELKALLAGQKPKAKAKGAAEFQATWNKWVEDTKTSAKKVSDAREALSAERGVADVSVFNPQTPVDPTMYDGEMATKDYTISAECVTPDQKHVTKTLVVTLQQARLKGEKPITGKWIVTKIKDQSAAGKTS